MIDIGTHGGSEGTGLRPNNLDSQEVVEKDGAVPDKARGECHH